MKCPRQSERRKNPKRVRNATLNDNQVTELLKVCLQKVCELQEDLRRSDGDESNPEAAGYAACATETLRFLTAEGIPADHPIVKELQELFTRNRM
ncbi:hypothetical protein RN001_013279 [Aquatica leii]|uniref:Uncharacterized protein n=1 Tax=Aquatica leii TaxID=1421715 RepID=A0AAN7PQE9_9COLE|nr:hypothetical protein RN001_013279 [Aquatica leii]